MRLGFCATFERDYREQLARRLTSQHKRAVAWELLDDIYRANNAGNQLGRCDLMLQLALLTDAQWYLEREEVAV